MKITDLTLYKVPPRWLFLKISTDEGIDGWGEPVIEGRADTVRTAVEEFRNYLIGKDPANIEDHWQVMYRCGFYRGGPEVMSAIAGIDQALWDIKGKKLGVPVYELLGGACRDKLRVYRWIGGDRPSDIKANVLEAKAQGYSAIKMNATEEMHYIDSFKKIDAVCERVAIIRDTLGMDMDIAEVSMWPSGHYRIEPAEGFCRFYLLKLMITSLSLGREVFLRNAGISGRKYF